MLAPPSPAVVWTIRLLALTAGGLAAYLWVVSDLAKALPVGCGNDSGCAAVLTSRWSSVAGVSVAALALALDLAVVVLSFGLTSQSETTRTRAATGLTIAAWALLGAAIWFVGLQQVVLGATCPWCLGTHAVGVILAGVVLATVTAKAALEIGVWRPAIAAMAALGVMMAVQIYVDPPPNPLHRLGDVGTSAGELVTLFDGKLVVDRLDVPRIGDLAAPKTLALLFDYCCPHCRATHEMLAAARGRYPNQFVVLALPTPMNSDCNPHHDHTEPRFKNACELARFALAVWRADPAKFAEYDEWLFAPEAPREIVEAQTQAERLVGQDEFADALVDPWVEAQLRRNVDGYAASQAERIPVLAGPGITAIVGRPDDEAALFDVFEREWSLKPATATPAATADAR